MSVAIPDIIRFNADGLIPAVVQDIESGRVLMLAYMNRESLARTLATGETWFTAAAAGSSGIRGLLPATASISLPPATTVTPTPCFSRCARWG